MFLKEVRINRKEKVYRYLRLLESYRQKGKVKQRVLASFGNLDTLGEDTLNNLANALIAFANRKKKSDPSLSLNNVPLSNRVFAYGDCLLIEHLWQKLNLSTLISQCLSQRKFTFALPLAVLVMVINRLLGPKSKLSVERWQKKIFLPSLKSSPSLEYNHFLRALDALSLVKPKIEKYIFSQLTDLFNLKLNLVFYDLTSVYFEGLKCPLAAFGYSRDHRCDARQIVLGLLVTDEGLPIAHEVYTGNTADKSTLAKTVDKLKTDFAIKRIIFVADRGIASQKNIAEITTSGYEYIISLRKRANQQVLDLLSKQLEWTQLETNLNTAEVKKDTLRYIFCKNTQKETEDKAFRENLIAKVKLELEKLKSKRVNFKYHHRIIASAAKTLQKTNTAKYFTYSFTRTEGFSFHLNQPAIKTETTLDGLWVLQTNANQLALKEVVNAYKNLASIESAFRQIKDFLKIRPVYHYSESRVKGHVFICVLAYLIEKLISNQLLNKNIPFSAQEALERLSDLKLVENEWNNHLIYSLTSITNEQKQILQAFNLTNIPRTLMKISQP